LLAAGNNRGVDRPPITLSMGCVKPTCCSQAGTFGWLSNGSTPGEEMLMPVKCPSCNLMFGTRNELDWHVREEHTRSRLPARTPPADDTTPADLTAPVTVGAAHAGPDSPPPSPDQPQPDTTAIAPKGPLAWLRRRLRPSGTSRQPASVDKPQDNQQR
jgi:hypothetical protein